MALHQMVLDGKMTMQYNDSLLIKYHKENNTV